MNLREIAEMVGSKVWQKAGKNRVYFKTDRRASAYIEYEEDLGNGFEKILADGAVLKVFSNCASQGALWNVNRAKQIKFGIMKKIAEFDSLEICERWEDVIL